MTDEQKRIAIAEACGWKKTHTLQMGSKGKYVATYQKGRGKLHQKLPDYFRDLNAMHEAEKVLKTHPLTWGLYCNTLGLLCGGAKSDDGGIFISHKDAIDAPARLRAEAFGLTLGLWQP